MCHAVIKYKKHDKNTWNEVTKHARPITGKRPKKGEKNAKKKDEKKYSEVTKHVRPITGKRLR